MVNYSPPPLQGNYSVTYDENQGGMEVIYDITNVFLDAVIGGNMFPNGFLNIETFPTLGDFTTNFPDAAMENIQEIIVQNIGILICIILGPLMALATLICGLCFCCCCCNKKTTTSDGGTGLKTALLSALLLLLLVITSVGCMWFFLGAGKATTGLDELPEVGGELFARR